MIEAAQWFRQAEALTYTTRADGIETVHGGHFCVVDGETGAVMHSAGIPELPVFPRSSLKFIQALPLVESGAADAFALSETHLALSCASHYGEAGHATLVQSWLSTIGCNPSDLVCGHAWPWRADDRESYIRQGHDKAPELHNCSGKHSGFLTVCRHQGWTVKDYDSPDHPAQALFKSNLLALSGCAEADLAWGVDGCALPTPSLPMVDMARALASFSRPKLNTVRGQAQQRLLDAIAAQPWYLAGTDDLASALAHVTQGRIIGKIGADGYYAIVVRDKGWGLAIKTLDGSLTVVDAALFAILCRLGLLSDAEKAILEPLALKPVTNSRGDVIGRRFAL